MTIAAVRARIHAVLKAFGEFMRLAYREPPGG
jgi:hypothetical protein